MENMGDSVCGEHYRDEPYYRIEDSCQGMESHRMVMMVPERRYFDVGQNDENSCHASSTFRWELPLLGSLTQSLRQIAQPVQVPVVLVLVLA